MFNYILILVTCVIACNASPAVPKQGSFNRYLIYTRTNARLPIEIDPTDIPDTTKALLETRNTAIIVHGHGGSSTSSLNPILKDAFLQSEDVNVIVVDWSIYASLSYSIATAAVPSVGVSLANFINELTTKTDVTVEKLHLVGFDLGAHVVGFAGRALQGKVARITGLNPSGNHWGVNTPRLNKSDALYVEVIHTDGMGLLSNGVGDDIGHVDFYVNGGTNQPGCFLNNLCSHNRAWEVMAATLTHDHLVGNRCGSWAQVTMNTCAGFKLQMGNNDFFKFGSGRFRVNTRRSYPF